MTSSLTYLLADTPPPRSSTDIIWQPHQIDDVIYEQLVPPNQESLLQLQLRLRPHACMCSRGPFNHRLDGHCCAWPLMELQPQTMTIIITMRMRMEPFIKGLRSQFNKKLPRRSLLKVTSSDALRPTQLHKNFCYISQGQFSVVGGRKFGYQNTSYFSLMKKYSLIDEKKGWVEMRQM